MQRREGDPVRARPTTSGLASAAQRLSGPVLYSIGALLFLLFFLEVHAGWTAATGTSLGPGHDLTLYLDATRRLLSGGPWYLERQVHGPYVLEFGDILYPPVTAWFFAPWLVLPIELYMAIPVVVMGVLLYMWRPAPWTWPLMGLCLVYLVTALKVADANPIMWIATFVGLGLRYNWPAALVLLKPSVFPFAIIGIRDRRWWITTGLIVVLSIPFLGETLAWPRVVLSATGYGTGFLYSLVEVPLLMVPVIAWLGRTRRASRRDPTSGISSDSSFTATAGPTSS